MTRFRRFTLIALLFLFLWLIGFAAFSFYALSTTKPEIEHTSDAIIVLTGGANRVEEGLALFATGKAGNLMISGVHPDVKKAEIFSQWHGDTALPPCCLTLGQTATTTYENAQESKHWVEEAEITSIILVTSNYHMPRAMLEFKAAIPDIEIRPYAIRQDNLDEREKRIWYSLFEEYHKVMLRWVQLIFS